MEDTRQQNAIQTNIENNLVGKGTIKMPNEYLEINFKKLSAKEIDMFIYMLANTLNTDNLWCELSYANLRQGAQLKNKRETYKFYEAKLNQLSESIISSYVSTVDEEGRTFRYTIFSKIGVDPVTQTFVFKINNDFKEVFKRNNRFTILDIERLISFKSGFTKRLFCLLVQWSSQNKKRFRIAERDLRRKMDAESYTYGNFKNRCLKPALAELRSYFDIFMEEEFGRKKKVTYLTFTFTKKDDRVLESNKPLEIDDITLKPNTEISDQEIEDRYAEVVDNIFIENSEEDLPF